MKTLVLSIVAGCCLVASAALAGPVDGNWTFEQKMKGRKGSGEVTVNTVLTLAAEGDKLTGSVSSNRGKRGRSLTIQDGKIEGNKISFVTVQKNRKANKEMKVRWEGTVEGDQLQGTQSAEGRKKRGTSFTAKRS